MSLRCVTIFECKIWKNGGIWWPCLGLCHGHEHYQNKRQKDGLNLNPKHKIMGPRQKLNG